MLEMLDTEREDAVARDAAFAKAKKAAALLAAAGDLAGAVAAWHAFLKQYPDPLNGDLELSAKAKEAIEAIRLLTRANR